MRIIIIAVIALLVLGGGAAGAYFYFSQSAEASLGEEAGKDHTENKDHAKKDDHGDGLGYGALFVEMDPLVLPIVDKNGVNQVVSLVIALEVKNSSAEAKVAQLTPRLKDAYIQDLYGVLNKHAAMKGGVVQVSQIKSRLNEISADVLGEDVVQGVLLQVVQQRPM